ncbi:unnamed protein product [Rangifer tarandus platyrhynchus]|uniref:Uncharacterized protein n=1 Tax=Rangifer tarandus platyrhynchus TaxID=3082113 RepID=A0ABN8Y3E7_RANTA|nr:unnamed protein product [Rangifer tarandus platyrhynchus]
MILRAQLQKTKELLAPPLPENKLPSCTDFVLVAADLSGTLQRSDTALEPANKRHNQCTTAITGATVSASPSLLSCPRTESGAPSVGGCPDPQQMAGPSPHSASRPPVRRDAARPGAWDEALGMLSGTVLPWRHRNCTVRDHQERNVWAVWKADVTWCEMGSDGPGLVEAPACRCQLSQGSKRTSSSSSSRESWASSQQAPCSVTEEAKAPKVAFRSSLSAEAILTEAKCEPPELADLCSQKACLLTLGYISSPQAASGEQLSKCKPSAQDQGPTVCTPPDPGDTLDVTLIMSLGHHESPGSSVNTAGCPQRTGLHPYTLGERGRLALGNRWARAREGSRAGPGPSVRREKTTAVPGRGAPVGSQEPDPPGYKKALAHPDPGPAGYRSPSRNAMGLG